MKKIIVYSICCLSAIQLQAQTFNEDIRPLPGLYPQAVEYPTDSRPAFVKGQVLLYKDESNYKASTEVIFVNKEADQLGQEHYRYQQTINGLPVDGAIYVVHIANGKILRQNGSFAATLPADLASTPALSGDAAVQKAIAAFGAQKYKWQVPREEQLLKEERNDATATFYPKADLVYYCSEGPLNPAKMRLAYKLDLYALEPLGHRIYFIDALNGLVLGKRELLQSINRRNTAVQTVYSGQQTICTDSTAGAGPFRLREEKRGSLTFGINNMDGNQDIITFNLSRTSDYSSITDFTNTTNTWNVTNMSANLDQYALDAHWGAERTYDYYRSTFGRNGINNAGFALKSYVHYGVNYFNAYWDGYSMIYGDGSSYNGYRPLTAIDVCGHEITHGLVAYTAQLNYYGESGALNEGFADIFGKNIEYYARGTKNWNIGYDFRTLRSLATPKAYGQPNCYKGMNWAIGEADGAGVHTNSGVLNFWYYLLCEGGKGYVDDIQSTGYNVTAIGMATASAIAYRTLTVYLTVTSTYDDTRRYSIQAATDLYGGGSNAVTQVIEAWKAVGLLTPVPSNPEPVCMADTKGNETKAMARAISIPGAVSATIEYNGDVDWYKFSTTNATPKLKILLSNLPANYSMSLFKNAGTTALRTTTAILSTTKSISYNGSGVKADYFVKVFGIKGAYKKDACYNLLTNMSNVNQLIDDDDTDDNDSSGTDALTGMWPADEDLTALQVYPNPATDVINISCYADFDLKKQLTIMDITGRTVLVKALDLLQGSNEYQVPLGHLPPSLYFIKMEGFKPVKFQVQE